MAYTRHGHHIPGTLKGQGVTKAPVPKRCGGVENCDQCIEDVRDYIYSVDGTNENNQRKAKEIVKDYIESRLRRGPEYYDTLRPYTIMVSWYSKTLTNWKAVVTTSLGDGMYYEVTYNGDKRESYLCAYRKTDNVCIPDGAVYHGQSS